MNLFKNDWDEILKFEFEKPYFSELMKSIDYEYEKYQVFPPRELLFRSLEDVSFSDVNVLILGQDPYHNIGQANGYAFSVGRDVKLPPSLRNIFKELKLEFNDFDYEDGDLTPWVNQGVLLLNSILTVRENEPSSHSKLGWEIFTDAVISCLSKRQRPLVFILWGNYSKKKVSLIDQNRHRVITGVHPSPLSASRGFFNKGYFLDANRFLENQGVSINWNLKED